MKRRKIAGTASVIGTAALMSACGLYGPPKYTPETTTSGISPDVSDVTTSFSSEEIVPECIYGPPEMFSSEETEAPETTVTTTTTTTEETAAASTTTADSLIRPADVQAIYGPPVMFTSEDTDEPETSGALSETSTAPETDDTETEEDTSFDAAEDIYGPPEWFGTGTEEEPEDPDETEDTEDTEDTTEYKPDDNVGEDVYGPPEWFE